MHGAAHAAAAAVTAAEQLGHHAPGRNAPDQRMHVLAIGADHVVG